jgi:RND family efflux transporter MFP subunit
MFARIAGGAALLATLVCAGCDKSSEAARLPDKAEPAPASSVLAAAPESAQAWTRSSSPDSDGGTGSGWSGTTEAHRKSTLTPKVSSTVVKVTVRDGDIVKAGQVLVTMDTRDFVLRTQAAEAQLESAKVGMDAAKLEWDRLKGLADENAIPKAQFDQIDAKLKGAKAGVSAAETAVAMGKKGLSDSVVTAPFGGIVVKRHTNEGEYATMMPATPLVTIEEIDPIDVRIQVPSSDMNRVHRGDPVRVRLPANGTEINGTITRIVPANDARTRSFSAIVELPNHDHSLRSGLYAEIETIGSSTTAAAPRGTR